MARTQSLHAILQRVAPTVQSVYLQIEDRVVPGMNRPPIGAKAWQSGAYADVTLPVQGPTASGH